MDRIASGFLYLSKNPHYLRPAAVCREFDCAASRGVPRLPICSRIEQKSNDLDASAGGAILEGGPSRAAGVPAANTGTHRWRVNFGAESQKLGACIGVAMVRSCAQWKVVVMGALVHVKPGLREQAYG